MTETSKGNSKNRRWILAGAAVCILAILFAVSLPGMKQSYIRNRCKRAVGRLSEYGSIQLSQTGKENDESNWTIDTYYDNRDGQPRWYEIEYINGIKKQRLMIGNAIYTKTDLPESMPEFKTTWGKSRDTYDVLSEAIEGKARDVSYPRTLQTIMDWDGGDDHASVIERRPNGSYNFIYSSAHLKKKRDKKVEDQKQFYEMNKEGIARGIIDNQVELRDLMGRRLVRQIEETHYVWLSDSVTLGRGGDLQKVITDTIYNYNFVKMNIETGEFEVSDDISEVTMRTVTNVVAVNEPAISDYLDEMVAVFEQEYKE